jgi:putative ABC transport system permease protein
MVLAVIGAVAGTFIARWAISAVVELYPHNLPRAEQVGIDPRVLIFTGVLAILTGILFGLAPALQASRTNLNEAMREGGRGAVGSSQQSRLRSALVVAETAVGVMLLIGAGLLIRSMNRLSHVDLGLDPDHVLTANFDLSQTRYNADQQDRFYTQLLNELKALPGVTSVSSTGQLPLANDDWSISFNILERPLPKGQQPAAGFYDVSPGFFETLKISLLRGRFFDEHDTRQSKPVMIINQEFAKKYFPNEDPIGKMVEIGIGDGQKRAAWKTREIVGIVANIRSSEIGSAPRDAYFVPMPQLIIGPPTLLIRTAGDPSALVSGVRKTLASMDADAPLYDIKPLADYFALDLGRARFQTVLLSLFAGVALVLTAIGLYGVIAYAVVQRTHEIGVRMALGASRSDVLRMILNRGLMLTLTGVGVGVIGALALARLIESLLYEIPPRDPMTYIVVCFTLSAVALLASYIPALRATRVDPIIALRYE